VHTYPFRERLWQQLMRALHRADRRAEALQLFAEHSAYLRAELGAGPSREVTDLYRSLLRDEPTEPGSVLRRGEALADREQRGLRA
jgi:DNA-binding SARP family transcriptional activator